MSRARTNALAFLALGLLFAGCAGGGLRQGSEEPWPPGQGFVPAAPQPWAALGAARGREPAATTGGSGDSPALDLPLGSEDPTYGWTLENPVPIGASEGPRGQAIARYLNALWGPEGQPIEHRSLGRTAPGPSGVALEVYAVTYDGLDEPLRLFVDPLTPGQLRVPVGLSSRPAGDR